MSTRRELIGLLDRLCEQRTTAAEHARIQQLVLADDDALRLYLSYVTLHGHLHWDTAIGDVPAPPPVVSPPSRTNTSGADRRRRRRIIGATAACIALAAVTFAVLRPPAGQPIAKAPPAKPVVADTPPALAKTGTPTSISDPPPTVRLHPSEASPTQITSGDAPIAPLLATHDVTDNAIDDAADPSAQIVAFIDEQLAAGWAANELTPSPRADDAEWVRRASLDLAGHIPDLATVRAFLADNSPNKRQQFVEERLRGGDLAANLTTVWANLLVGRRLSATRERRGLEEFLLRQFRQNRPWNETVGELVAAEGSVEDNGAAGFLLAHLNNEAVPATALTARLFLGEQVQCSQCHKHPWNDEPQEQFWTLNAFFQQTAIERKPIADRATGKDRTVPVLVSREVGGPTYYENLRGVMQVAYPQYGGEAISPEATVNRRRELARLLSEEDGHRLARAFVNRMWAHFFGYGFVNPIDDMGPHQSATHPELLDRLSQAFAEGGYDVAQLVRWITSSRAYQLTSRMEEGNAADDPSAGDPPQFSRMYVKPLSPEQLFDSVRIATASDSTQRAADTNVRADRDRWVRQFFEVLENEENGEVSTFGGTLPQALSMMNGPLVETALSGQPGTVLHQILTSRSSDADKLKSLCLATLGREPTEKERSQFTRHLRQATTPAAKADAFRDVLWIYLNTNEFVVNH